MLGLPDHVTACLFDMDGVLTRTATVHAAAWKQTFDLYLRSRDGDGFTPFDHHDYDRYVDGRTRADGVRTFLASRHITLPEGDAGDPPTAETVSGLGNRKNALLLERIHRDGVQPYEGSVRYLRAARAAGLRRAVVSASANAEDVLRSAGLADQIEVRIDGVVIRDRGLAGKPAPDTYLAAAEALGVDPAHAAVFEDALSGVEAGRAGHFGAVVGVDRVGQAADLAERGATVVVGDLAELLEPAREAGAPGHDGGPAMIPTPTLALEDWGLRETGLDLPRMAQTESLLALSNGHIGVRGTLDEGEPHALPGTYLNSYYEVRPLPYAEGGYGYPEAGQTVVNVVDAKPIRLLVDDEPFDLRYGQAAAHERFLDLRAGLLRRSTEWTSPGRRTVRVRSTRMVSLVQRAMLAVEWEVEVLHSPARVVVQSELVANEDVPVTSGDPRVAAALRSPLEILVSEHSGLTLSMLARTRVGGLRMAVMAHHLWEGPEDTEHRSDSYEETARCSWITTLEPGQTLRIVKLVAYGWSRQRSVPALRDQVSAALVAAEHTGWQGMLDEQHDFLSDYWDRSAVDLEGDDHLQRAIRFAMFHVLQSGLRSEGRGIPAKGLTGPGYDGHKFWDTETFVLPVFTYTMPGSAGDALMWRHRILPAARDRAAQLGLAGAAFPWRTIAGEECSAYWPAGTAAFHLAADIADAVTRYVDATGDIDWERTFAVDILVETARLWASLGYFADGHFRIDGVTGPDEYTAVHDNNVFTNLMAKRNLLAAADAVERYPGQRLDIEAGEVDTWRKAAACMTVPFDEALGVHPQAEGFTDHATWDFDAMGEDDYPLLLHFPYFDLYRKQVVKQADLVLALHLCGDEFTDEQKVADFEYYEPLTVRDSSLSATTQGIIAAETGHLDLAFRYLREAALMDIDDLERNTRDGLHMASLAGAWLVPVAGFGGMRDTGGRLRFRPRLPRALSHLGFSLLWRGRRLRVDITRDAATYGLHEVASGRVLVSLSPGGDPAPAVTINHYDEELTIRVGERHRLSIPSRPERHGVAQPAGRGPLERR